MNKDKRMARAAEILALYLDDLLLLAAGICFTAAGWEIAGRPGALISAGACLTVYALVIARARRGGGGR